MQHRLKPQLVGRQQSRLTTFCDSVSLSFHNRLRLCTLDWEEEGKYDY